MGSIKKFSNYNIYMFFLKMIIIMPWQTAYLLFNSVINALIPAVQTFAVAEFINTVESIFTSVGTTSEVIWPFAAMIAVIVFQNVMPSVTNLVNESAQNRLKFVLRERFVRKQTVLKYYYIENEEFCALIHRVCEEPEKRFGKGFQNICDGIGLVVKCISLLGIVMRASWISGVAILAVSIPLFYMAMKTGKKNYALQNKALEIKRRYQYLADILTSREYAKERAVFDYNNYIEEEYDKYFQYANRKEEHIEKKKYANMKSGSLITILLGVIIMFLLLPSMKEGRISSGLYVGLVSAVLSLVQGMSWNLSGVMQGYASTKAYLEDVNIFWNLEEKEDADVEPQKISDFQLHSIEFRHVSFRYPGEKEYVLRDCSFILRGDKCYSVVGRNGAGKSTFTKLLVGLYEDYEGEILINGLGIQEYRYAEIKGMISVVFQDFARYALSIQDNILIGNIKHKDKKLLKRICKELEIDEFVQRLPHGLDSMLGKVEEGSVDLSGGQWQKLALARLLYSEAPINILDEPTAALDAKAEAKVYETFQKVNSKAFTIFITHRLGAARLADEILVLDQGRIVEQGTHEQLLTHEKGLYRDMFESQRSWYEA